MDNVATIGAERGEFRFRLAGSKKTWALPLMGSLTISQARMMARVSEAGDDAAAVEALADMLDALCPGLCDALTQDGATEVLSAWREASGISAGD